MYKIFLISFSFLLLSLFLIMKAGAMEDFTDQLKGSQGVQRTCSKSTHAFLQKAANETTELIVVKCGIRQVFMQSRVFPDRNRSLRAIYATCASCKEFRVAGPMSSEFYTEVWGPVMEGSRCWREFKDEGPIKWTTLTVYLADSSQKSLVDPEETAREMLGEQDQHPRRNISCCGLAPPTGPADDRHLDQLLIGTSSRSSINFKAIAGTLDDESSRSTTKKALIKTPISRLGEVVREARSLSSDKMYGNDKADIISTHMEYGDKKGIIIAIKKAQLDKLKIHHGQEDGFMRSGGLFYQKIRDYFERNPSKI